jgi:hypothetical protein
MWNGGIIENFENYKCSWEIKFPKCTENLKYRKMGNLWNSESIIFPRKFEIILISGGKNEGLSDL